MQNNFMSPAVISVVLLIASISGITNDASAQSVGARSLSNVPAAKTPPVTKLSEIATSLQWVGPAVSEKDFYIWCTSPIEGPDGKTHLFVSRWPKIYKMDGWRTHCEIAHYVGDQPEGPFKFRDVALSANPDALWNNTKHNPCIRQVGNKYYLLYMSFDRRPLALLAAGKTPNWIGMAVSDSLEGPWKNLSEKEPLFLPSQNTNHWSFGDWQFTNPTFLAYGGKYYLYFHGGKHVGKMKSYQYAYAVADKPEGPYTLGETLPSGYKSSNINWLREPWVAAWFWVFASSSAKVICENAFTLKTCRIWDRLRCSPNSFLKIATRV